MNRVSAALLASVLLFLVPGIAQAEVPMNIPFTRSFIVSLEGEAQGKFMNLDGLWFEHSAIIPTDPQSGQPTGQRVHKPVTFIYPFGPASPMIFRALTSGERLKNVTISFVRPGAQRGQEVVYATIELHDAVFVEGKQFMQGNRLLEEVSLTFRKIVVWDRVKGIKSEDDWRAPRGR